MRQSYNFGGDDIVERADDSSAKGAATRNDSGG